jgi:hypothetical protein
MYQYYDLGTINGIELGKCRPDCSGAMISIIRAMGYKFVNDDKNNPNANTENMMNGIIAEDDLNESTDWEIIITENTEDEPNKIEAKKGDIGLIRHKYNNELQHHTEMVILRVNDKYNVMSYGNYKDMVDSSTSNKMGIQNSDKTKQVYSAPGRYYDKIFRFNNGTNTKNIERYISEKLVSNNLTSLNAIGTLNGLITSNDSSVNMIKNFYVFDPVMSATNNQNILELLNTWSWSYYQDDFIFTYKTLYDNLNTLPNFKQLYFVSLPPWAQDNIWSVTNETIQKYNNGLKEMISLLKIDNKCTNCTYVDIYSKLILDDDYMTNFTKFNMIPNTNACKTLINTIINSI